MAIFRTGGGRRREASDRALALAAAAADAARKAEIKAKGRVLDDRPGRPFSELRDTGLLWLINRTCFHPRGFALALHVDDGEVTGWSLDGDGSEPWAFDDNIDDRGFERAEATLKETRT